MSKQGFKYSPHSEDETASADESITGLPNTLSNSEAAKHGYRKIFARENFRDETLREELTRTDQYLQELSDSERRSYNKALMGTATSPSVRYAIPETDFAKELSSEGCLADARGLLYGSTLNYLRVTNFQNTIRAAIRNSNVTKSPDISNSLKHYQRCMQTRGFRVSTPDDAEEMARSEFEANGKLTSDERLMAVSDSVCRERSELYENFDRISKQALLRWLRHNDEEVRELRRLQQNSELRASKYLHDQR